ncbi:MAG: hypothetical protein VB031_07055 [Eubacteriaceae bacterium]|nr:hypothetical protein [Eubacteriaceae bacterium]
MAGTQHSKKEIWGILFSPAFLGIIYSQQLGIEAWTPWPILGIALCLSIGLTLVFPRLRHGRRQYRQDHGHDRFQEAEAKEETGSAIFCKTTFGSSVKYINTENLEKIFLDSG